MRHWGPEGSARLIDVFHRKAADKVFQEGCWFSGLFLPTGADPQLNAVIAASCRPSHALCRSWVGLCPHLKSQGNLGFLEEERSPTCTLCCCTSSVLLPQPPLWWCGQEKYRVCRPWGNSYHCFSLFFSLMLASTLHRDKGKGCAPCPKVTLTTPSHGALAGPR